MSASNNISLLITIYLGLPVTRSRLWENLTLAFHQYSCHDAQLMVSHELMADLLASNSLILLESSVQLHGSLSSSRRPKFPGTLALRFRPPGQCLTFHISERRHSRGCFRLTVCNGHANSANHLICTIRSHRDRDHVDFPQYLPTSTPLLAWALGTLAHD